MAKQVRKIFFVVCSAVILITAIGGTVSAENYTAYDGNISSSQLVYFEDALSNVSILDDYVVFRDSQYTYKMVVGKLSYNNSRLESDTTCKVYSLDTQSSGYNQSYYKYDVFEIDNFYLTPNDKIVYSNLGDYPQLEERGSKFETITTIIICVALLSVVIGRIFNKR